MNEGLLEGVKVVDLSTVLAGPFAASILAEMGADVIKVEPQGGDVARVIGRPTRRTGAPRPITGYG